MLLAHKIELVPANKFQLQYLVDSAGCARFSYNWALTEWKKRWEKQKKLPKVRRKYISDHDLRKHLNAIKRTEYPFLLQVSKYVSQESFEDFVASAVACASSRCLSMTAW